MFIESIVKDKGRVSLIEQAIEILVRAGYFPAGNEIAQRKLSHIVSATPIETAALQRYYLSGYADALEDLFHFKERFVETKVQQKQKTPDFGGIATLLKAGDITEEEANELRR